MKTPREWSQELCGTSTSVTMVHLRSLVQEAVERSVVDALEWAAKLCDDDCDCCVATKQSLGQTIRGLKVLAGGNR